MIIYNITFNIEEQVAPQWQAWLQRTYIPMHYQTGLFTGHLFSEVQVQEELGGTTYSLQFFTPSELTYRNFIELHSDSIDTHLFEKFGDKFVFFKSMMKNIESKH